MALVKIVYNNGNVTGLWEMVLVFLSPILSITHHTALLAHIFFYLTSIRDNRVCVGWPEDFPDLFSSPSPYLSSL